jgi:ABC-type phosphate transport system substrate-binding protein
METSYPTHAREDTRLEKLLALAYYGFGLAHYVPEVLACLYVFRNRITPPTWWWVGLGAAAALTFLAASTERIGILRRSPSLRMVSQVAVITALTLLLCSLFLTLIPRNYSLKIHGSPTIARPLAVKLAKEYLKNHVKLKGEPTAASDGDAFIVKALMWNNNPISIEIKASSNWQGYEDLAEDKCDIAMTSKRMPRDLNSMTEDDRKDLHKQEAVEELQDLWAPATEVVIGIDGMVVVANKELLTELAGNQMSKHDLHDIFLGQRKQYRPWLPPRESKEFMSEFLERFTDPRSDGPDPLRSHDLNFVSNSAEICRTVSENNRAIAIAPLHDVQACPENWLGISPPEHRVSQATLRDVQSEEYPLTERLYLYTSKKKAKDIDDVKKFLSISAQESEGPEAARGAFVVERFWDRVADSSAPDYAALANDARRYSLDFRFDPDGELEPKAKQDLDGFKSFIQLEGRGGDSFLVVGFAKREAPPGALIPNAADNSCGTSLAMADKVGEWLRDRNIKVERVVGFGDLLPLGFEGDSDSAFRSNRVEIWKASKPDYAGAWTCAPNTAGVVLGMQK